jgi:hypothetical protein
MTLAMIIMICVGVALIIAGLVVLVLKAIGLFRAVRAAQAQIDAEVKQLLSKQQAAMTRLADLQAKQPVLMDKLQHAQVSMGRLTFLVGQFSSARSRLTSLVRP